MARADSIGIKFADDAAQGPNGGNGNYSLSPTAAAGVVPVTHYNNLAGSTNGAGSLAITSAAGLPATLSYSGGGVYGTSGNAPTNNDEILNGSDIYGTTNGTINVPAAFAATGYDVYIYTENDAGGRHTITSLTTPSGGSSTTTFYYSEISGGAAGQIDGTANPFSYLQATNSSTSSDFSQTANYAQFSVAPGISSFDFHTEAGGNGALSGIEIVQTPEPATLGLVTLALPMLLRRRSR